MIGYQDFRERQRAGAHKAATWDLVLQPISK